ncbi:MAG: GGDEF domain-containing protein [Acidiferrobacterales bacterium]
MGNESRTRTISRVPARGEHEEPYLIILAGGPVGMMHKLRASGTTVIGRGLDADLRLEDEGVSRRHAQIVASEDGDPILEDLGSANGTFVNGAQIEKHTLKDGDKIQVGSVSILKFSYQDELEKTFQQELFDRGIKDGLTGVYNKRYFLDRILGEFTHARRHQLKLSLIIFDIDHFKVVNDTHGHPAGDFVLKELARLVRKMLRTADVFARYGGEEFALLMRDIDEAGALVLAQRIRQQVKQHSFEVKGSSISLTVSLGISALSDEMESADDLIQLADKYLYKAKRAGRNCIGGRAVKAIEEASHAATVIRKA